MQLQSFVKESQESLSNSLQQNDVSPNSSNRSQSKLVYSRQEISINDKRESFSHLYESGQVKRSLPKINIVSIAQESELDKKADVKSLSKSRTDIDQSNINGQTKKNVNRSQTRQSVIDTSSVKNQRNEQNLQSEMEGPNKITPGYTKYIVDENNAQYDYVRGMFSEEEVKEAFGILDMNKDGAITQDDLAFFLEFIGEKATQEDIEEMIKMCDLEGGGEVKYEEFYKMAGGYSLTPIGQAYPPTAELLEKRQLLNQMMFEKEVSVFQREQSKLLSQAHSEANLVNQLEQKELQQISQVYPQQSTQKKQRQVFGTNIKVVRSEAGELSSQNRQQFQLTVKEMMYIRKKNCLRFLKENQNTQSDMELIQLIFEKVKTLDFGTVTSCPYEETLPILGIEDDLPAKQLFNSLTSSPLREEYIKNSEASIIDQRINLRNMLMSLLGLVECRNIDKLELAYQIQDININDYIFFNELLSMIQLLYFLPDIKNFEKKLSKIMLKKGLKNTDIITKDVFMNMIHEYGQIFEPS